MFSKSSVVGDCIRAERRRVGLSQDQLAERLHVTRQTISNWEGGKSLPDIESLKALAEALCVPIERLIYPEGRSPSWPARLRPDVWCRGLGILVLALVLLCGISADGGAGWGFAWRTAVPIWYAGLIWGTILLGISRILTLLQDKGPRDTAPCRMSFPRFSGFPGLAFPPRLWYSTVRLPGIPGCFFADPAPFRALRRSLAPCYPA